MSDRMQIAALGAFLALGAIMVGVHIWDSNWPAPTISVVAALGSHLFVAYTMFMGALFAAYSLPVRNRAFAIFGILAAATVLGFAVLNTVPLDETNRLLAAGLTLSLLAALTIYSLVWGMWGLISGAIAFWEKPPPRLNGWQRIGIVVSILWALSAWVYTTSQPNRADTAFSACLEYEGSRPLREKADTGRCLERHKADFSIAQVERSQRAIVNALVPVLLGWMLVYIVIGTVHWIREGFETARPQ